MNIQFGARIKGDYNYVQSCKQRTEAAGNTTVYLGLNNQDEFVLLTNEDLPHAKVYTQMEETSKHPERIRAYFMNANGPELDSVVTDKT